MLAAAVDLRYPVNTGFTMARGLPFPQAEVAMLWTLLVLVLLLWVIGFLFDVAGGLIHLLLLVALVLFLVNIFSPRRRAV